MFSMFLVKFVNCICTIRSINLPVRRNCNTRNLVLCVAICICIVSRYVIFNKDILYFDAVTALCTMANLPFYVYYNPSTPSEHSS